MARVLRDALVRARTRPASPHSPAGAPILLAAVLELSPDPPALAVLTEAIESGTRLAQRLGGAAALP